MLVKVVRFILLYATFRGGHFSKNPVFSVIFSQKICSQNFLSQKRNKVKVNSVCHLQHIFHNHGAFFEAVSATISPKNCWFL